MKTPLPADPLAVAREAVAAMDAAEAAWRAAPLHTSERMLARYDFNDREREARYACIAAIRSQPAVAGVAVPVCYIDAVQMETTLKLRGTCTVGNKPLKGDIPLYTEAPAQRACGGEAGWLPIESAPRDGTDVLLYHPGYRRAFYTHRDKVPRFWVDRRQGIGSFAYEAPSAQATHWQPLPAPPALNSAASDGARGE